MKTTIEELLKMHSIPIVNANDVVAPPPSQDVDLAGVCFSLLYELTGNQIMTGLSMRLATLQVKKVLLGLIYSVLN